VTPPERRFGSSPAVGDLGHRLIRAHPNSEGGELDGGEEVVVALSYRVATALEIA